LELLPKDLGMLPRDESKVADDLQITLGPLEFDYSQIKQDILEGKSKLRLIKDVRGNVSGFTVVSPAEGASLIKMMWVSPLQRQGGLGEILLQDAVDISPKGMISMDIWGGEPMTKLATKLGFNQNPGGNMTNRYSYQK